jgi:hypothetical protein
MILGFADKNKMTDLKIRNEILEKENLRLVRDNNALNQRFIDEMENASFSIDWDAMKAFSVERNWNNGFPVTIIGYMLSEPVIHTEGESGESRVTYKDFVREWTLHCSGKKHEELIKEFNTWKAKKK